MGHNFADTVGRAESWPSDTAYLEAIGKQLKDVDQQRAKIIETARRAAIEACAEGISEVKVARALGVDRARTLRRWLGK
jgi:hypothetical protein